MLNELLGGGYRVGDVYGKQHGYLLGRCCDANDYPTLPEYHSSPATAFILDEVALVADARETLFQNTYA
jgi:hypothetical protein